MFILSVAALLLLGSHTVMPSLINLCILFPAAVAPGIMFLFQTGRSF